MVWHASGALACVRRKGMLIVDMRGERPKEGL